MNICSTQEVRAWEQNSVWLGVPTKLLMENAGSAVARTVYERIKPPAKVLIFAGVGGKAGDGFVAARHLDSFGYIVKVLLVYRKENIRHPDAKENLKTLFNIGVPVVEDYSRWIDEIPEETDVLIDALLGTGFKPPLREPYRTIIDKLNKIKAKLKVAIDVPSGVDGDTGAVDVAFKADVTVSMDCVKKGLLGKQAQGFVGEIVVASIGIPRAAKVYVGPGDYRVFSPRYREGAHKGVHGRVMVVGGSLEFVGAPWLAALSSLYAGVDLAYLAAPTPVLSNIISPEIIPVRLYGERLVETHVEKLISEINTKRVHALVLGPGAGRHEETVNFFCKLFEELARVEHASLRGIVVDADALYSCTLCREQLQRVGKRYEVVLTPHLGELRRLLEREIPNTLEHRIEASREAAKKINAVVLAKGAIDVIVSPNGQMKLNKTGSPQMTVGGTGDVLAGLVAAFLARGASAFYAAALAAFINGLAGERVASSIGRVTPMLLIEWLPRTLKELEESNT